MAATIEEFPIGVGTSIFQIFPRMGTSEVQLFSEFIDNSLQSFLDHSDELDKQFNQKTVHVDISWSNDEIVITDDAFGMNKEEFGNALRLNSPSKNYSKGSLGKYGIGLKYAAASLGGWYSIETTQYGSPKLYSGVLDIEELKKNIETLKCPVEITDESSHFTKITIKNLIINFDYQKQGKLLKLLSKIYSRFLGSGDLTLSINSIPVESYEPEYRKKENGQEYLEWLTEQSFPFKGKRYKYVGFIAILKKGSFDDAGLNLRQNKRVIQLAYKPNEIFGGGNDFRRQRIYGEIDFEGDEWVVRFDKSGPVWSRNGLEQMFIKSLKDNLKVQKILKIAVQLRKSDNPICKVTIAQTNAKIMGLKKQYTIGELVSFSVLPRPGWKIESVKVNTTVIQPPKAYPHRYNFTAHDQETVVTVSTIEDPNFHQNHQESLHLQSTESLKNTEEIHATQPATVSDKNTKDKNTLKARIEERFQYLQDSTFPDSSAEKLNVDENGIVIKFKNNTFSFLLSFINDISNKNFIEINEKQPEKNTYSITLNTAVPPYADINLTDREKDIMAVNAISFALARFISEKHGLPLRESQIFTNGFNKILKGD